MAVTASAMAGLIELVGPGEARGIVRLATAVDKMDVVWKKRFEEYIYKTTTDALRNSRWGMDFMDEIKKADFRELVMRHSFEVSGLGIRSTEKVTPVRPLRLSTKSSPIERRESFAQLRMWWDHWRKKQEMPRRQRIIAERIKRAYVKKCQEVWKKNSQDFLRGETASKEAAQRAIIEGARVVESRARMIVETETTHYYNQVRRDIYDQSEDVTHYVLLAIRDANTTKWCSSRNGLVYAKGDKLLVQNTPPLHWNCRSELLPLTPANPRHLKLINDKSRDARYRSVAALPPGWNTSELRN